MISAMVYSRQFSIFRCSSETSFFARCLQQELLRSRRLDPFIFISWRAWKWIEEIGVNFSYYLVTSRMCPELSLRGWCPPSSLCWLYSPGPVKKANPTHPWSGAKWQRKSYSLWDLKPLEDELIVEVDAQRPVPVTSATEFEGPASVHGLQFNLNSQLLLHATLPLGFFSHFTCIHSSVVGTCTLSPLVTSSHLRAHYVTFFSFSSPRLL